MFWRKKHKRRSKEEDWNHYQLFDLFDDLDKVVEILQHIVDSGNHSSELTEFISRYEEELEDLKHQNVHNFELIIEWFDVDSTWNALLNLEHEGLTQRICKRAKSWNEENEKYIN